MNKLSVSDIIAIDVVIVYIRSDFASHSSVNRPTRTYGSNLRRFFLSFDENLITCRCRPARNGSEGPN